MFSRGNPDLKRERSVDMDGGVIVRARRGGAAISNRLSIFLLRLDDMILWAPLPDYTWTPKNVDNATIAGLKYRSEFRYSEAIRASFDYVYSNARKTGTDTVLIYRPRHVAVFTNSLSAWRVTAGFSLRYSGEVFADEANTRELPASVTANMNLGVMVVGPGSDGGGIRLVYDIFNVTNEDHFLAEGYPLPKREHRLSLKADF
jgi:outer membrane cobalamin receptor